MEIALLTRPQCSGERPTCDTCILRNSFCCYTETETRQVKRKYENLRNKRNSFEEFFERLKTIPEQAAIEVLRRMRAGDDVATLSKLISDGDLLLQVSLVPEIRRLYEFPYVSGFPSHLFVPNNRYLDSWLYRSAFPHSTSRSGLSGRKINIPTSDRSEPAQDSLAQGSENRHATDEFDYHIAYQVPYHSAQMVEPIVERITATKWTSIIIDNQLLRRLLRAYFFYPHPCGPFVHKDLFFEDMAAGRTRFCSPLLVHAMLAGATVGCRSRNPPIHVLC